MVPIVRAKKVVLVGDHRQLPPVLDRNALSHSDSKLDIRHLEQSGFGKIFEIIDDSYTETFTTQYRMHPCISSMISDVFYKDIVIMIYKSPYYVIY